MSNKEEVKPTTAQDLKALGGPGQARQRFRPLPHAEVLVMGAHPS